MEADWLRSRLESGRSIESIAREAGKAPSTVAYWVNKHGLTSTHAVKHAARGAIAREALEELMAEGLTIRVMAERLDRSYSTVRHWLARHGLATPRALRLARRAGAGERGRNGPGQLPGSRRHGVHPSWQPWLPLPAVPNGRGRSPPSGDQADPGRRGGRRMRDLRLRPLRPGAAIPSSRPAKKSFSLAAGGLTRSLERAREEAAKCVLLCANCHAEVEGGIATIAQTGTGRLVS